MAGPERFELPTSSFEDLLSIQLNYGPINLARELGLEPRMTESKSVVLPLHYSRTIEFVSSCPIIIATIHPCNKLERDSVSYLGYRSSLVASMDLVGVEPITFYCFGPSKKPRQRDFLLLTLTKLGGNSWTRTNDRLRMKQLH